MNIMLIIVVFASFAIGQIGTGVFVALLVTFNVVMGSNQELKARASVEALAQLQVPAARVRRSGTVESIASTTLVPGDVVLLEAGDVVPADGRIIQSATLETQEASLTGESAPIAKDANALPAGDVALGDRTNLVFQNTQVTRGTATVLVTDTGASTQMGRIAGMVSATKRTRSPLQRELDGMTKIFGVIAWSAVAIIAIIGIARGQDTETLMLLCISTAISAIPVGLPTFVQTDALVGRAASRRVEGSGEVADRRRDARRDDGDQQRQDRHADDERDDRHEDARRRRLVHGRRRRLREDRRDPRRRRSGAGLPPSRLGPGTLDRRDGR